MRIRPTTKCTAVALGVLLSTGSYGWAAKVIGAAGGVQGNVTRDTEDRQILKEPVKSGREMYQNDTVRTDSDSRLQVLLKDQTVFTLGPEGEIKLDDFVYNEKDRPDSVSASVTKGVFRFVTGKVAGEDPANMSIKVPVGTIGIRGTIAFGSVSDKQTIIGLGGPGSNSNAQERKGGLEVKNDKGSVRIDRPGWGTIIEAGKAPIPPFPLPANLLDQILGALNTRPSSASGGNQASTGDGGSATASSGQLKASGIDRADLSAFQGNVDNSNNGVTTHATQDFANANQAISNITSWEQMGTVSGFSGQGLYSAFGDFARTTCGGSPCNTTDSNAFQFSIVVNFGNRSISGSSGVFTGDQALQDSANISQAFGTTGKAIISATGSQNVQYKFTFLNDGGTANKLSGTATVNTANNVGNTVQPAVATMGPNNL